MTFRDFSHLPELDVLLEQIIVGGSGLLVVAGPDPRPARQFSNDQGILSSGRGAIFGLLLDRILEEHPSLRCIAVSEHKAAFRVPRQFKRRVGLHLVDVTQTYAQQIEASTRRRPGLLAVDRLGPHNAQAILEAAGAGLWVLTQFDTLSYGAGAARHLLDQGLRLENLNSLTWILSVQRLAALCPDCKQPHELTAPQREILERRYPDLAGLISKEPVNMATGEEARQVNIGAFNRPIGCAICNNTGRYGDVAVFDVFHATAPVPDLFRLPSLLPMERYIWELAKQGHLALEDLFDLKNDHLRYTFNLLASYEHDLENTRSAYERKLAEIEASNRVLQQRTRSLIALQDIGQTLIASTHLRDLADKVCHRALELCGAFRAVLYFLHTDDLAGDLPVEVLATGGWNAVSLGARLAKEAVFLAGIGPSPTPYNRLPPGLLLDEQDEDISRLKYGIYVPLVAQGEQMGAMIVHATEAACFLPGEMAMLQTFANQAALAIQRAGLIEQLRSKIAQLEAAQAELVTKERLERELELARQVQQSVLPRSFPRAPGYRFAAQNQPARRVGGDFYDVISLDEGHFGVAIADVSDKGMPAALYMALARSLLLAEARRQRSPTEVVSSVNRLLLELGEPDMFVTLFYGVVDRIARRMAYVRAGHDRPVLLRQGITQVLEGDGQALGIFAPEAFYISEEAIDLQPNDRLVLYTDGLADVLSPEGELFGQERLLALLEDCAGLQPEGVCEAVFSHLRAYRHNTEQYDDMTLLVVGVE